MNTQNTWHSQMKWWTWTLSYLGVVFLGNILAVVALIPIAKLVVIGSFLVAVGALVYCLLRERNMDVIGLTDRYALLLTTVLVYLLPGGTSLLPSLVFAVIFLFGRVELRKRIASWQTREFTVKQVAGYLAAVLVLGNILAIAVALLSPVHVLGMLVLAIGGTVYGYVMRQAFTGWGLTDVLVVLCVGTLVYLGPGPTSVVTVLVVGAGYLAIRFFLRKRESQKAATA